jgi:hypothetical protein
MPLLANDAVVAGRETVVVAGCVVAVVVETERVAVVAGRAAVLAAVVWAVVCRGVLYVLLLPLLEPVMEPTVEATWPIVYCALLMSYMALLMVDSALPQAEREAVMAEVAIKVRIVFFIFS